MPSRKIGCALLVAAIAGFALLPSSGAAYRTGIGDEKYTMFTDPNWRALHVDIARYIAPYDVADSASGRRYVRAWLDNAQSNGVTEPLIAFYHSQGRAATKIPNVAKYTREVKKFMHYFPEVRDYQPWNEANRGNVREPGGGSFHSPTASQAAGFYTALRKACKSCRVVGLDVLDSQNVKATIRYINAFKSALHGHLPRIWGLHNYSDTNRYHSTGTKAVLKAVPGQVWLTETGGVVKFGGAFPTDFDRAAKAISYMFKLAKSNPRITRLYIYSWYGGDVDTERFDAGLVNADGTPRPGYFVVRKQLTGV